MKKNSPSAGISIGSASLILILVVVSTAIFAVLSLVSANSEKNLSQRSAKAVSDYYSADLAAAEKINGIIDAIAETGNAESALSLMGIDYRVTEKGVEIEFETEIDGRRTLRTKAVIEDESLEITEWKTVTKSNPDNSSPEMWDGSFDFESKRKDNIL